MKSDAREARMVVIACATWRSHGDLL